MSRSWTTGEIVSAILAFPTAIATLIAIQGALRKRYRRRTQHNTAQDTELGAVQIESDPSSMPALQQGVIQPLERGYLARDISQPSSVVMQPSQEHDRSVIRLRHLASVPESGSSSVTTAHEHEARFQQSRQSIGTSLGVVATWALLESRTKESEDQIAREKTEWQEERRSRDTPIAAFSSWPDLREE